MSQNTTGQAPNIIKSLNTYRDDLLEEQAGSDTHTNFDGRDHETKLTSGTKSIVSKSTRTNAPKRSSGKFNKAYTTKEKSILMSVFGQHDGNGKSGKDFKQSVMANKAEIFSESQEQGLNKDVRTLQKAYERIKKRAETLQSLYDHLSAQQGGDSSQEEAMAEDQVLFERHEKAN